MNIYDLKHWWRDLVSRNQSVFRFKIGFKHISIDFFDEMIGFYLRMPWVWKWRWETFCSPSFPSVVINTVYALETPVLEIVFVDRLGLLKSIAKAKGN